MNTLHYQRHNPRATFEAFMKDDFFHAVLKGTRLKSQTETYSVTALYVKFFDNDTYSLFWSHEFPKGTKEPGILLSIPALNYKEWDAIYSKVRYEKIVPHTVLYTAIQEGQFSRVQKVITDEFNISANEF